ncbi:translation elongation factor G [candidate division WOR-3 bacterium RBG_13_43_14]|uniref:Elongation factor G n=1 Tax=candidate division WOR-3 bacterium RBG_13_43_14 TaxID=1802590 RepID=A0A1F4UCQ5_UNCW3|nr:MAG: translation elongation factor G [candidate division WOR-3 bacterium RBG_13_43_14]
MSAKSIRNIGFFGHASVGKTTISDAVIFLAGANSRFGKVSDKTSVFDFDPEEAERICSLNLTLASFEYKNTLFNIIDTPGYSDFLGEAISGVEAIDCAIIVVDAVAGVEVGTERILSVIEKHNKPVAFFLNKMKKENADFQKAVASISEITKKNIVPITIPVGEAQKFSGVIDILKEKKYGAEEKEESVPADLKASIDKARDKIIEAAADADDALMNKYLEGNKVELPECIPVLKKAISQGRSALLFCGEALDLTGVKSMIEAAVEFLPAPDEMPDLELNGTKIKRSADSPFLGYVFKTAVEQHLGELCLVRVLSGKIESGSVLKNINRGNDEKINQILLIKGKDRKETNNLTCGMIGGLVKLKDTHTSDTLTSGKFSKALPAIEFPKPSISMAIVPKAKGDEEKISTGLNRLRDEDPTFRFAFDPEIKQLIISGIGELHLDVILSRLKRKYGVSVDLTKPKIKYRETFTKKAEAQGKYKKQTGGHGQYGDCWLRVEPKERSSGFEFENAVVGGSIPSRFIPSVEKGVKEAIPNGYLAGYPLTDIIITVFDGSYHDVDSSDIAFKIAASMALKSCAEKGNMVLLEPIHEVEVYVPEEFMGDVIGDINSRRGKIMGMESLGKFQVVKAIAPEAEMFKYSTSLRSMTQGRGYFNMKFHHYEEVPKETTQKIIAEYQREKESQ